jgi:hypothetical protein
MYQIGTEQIEFVIQSGELTHQLVLYSAVHQFIVSLSRILCLTGSSRVASLIATLAAPVRLTTIAVTRSAAYNVGGGEEMLKLDYVSCILTIISTVLIGKKLWQGWVIAGANSIIFCLIGMRTAQFGFVPANLFCIALYANNLWNWRPRKECKVSSRSTKSKKVS